MHASSYAHMRDLADRYLDRSRPLQILDIGSYDVNGSYKPIFDTHGWEYRGVDLTAGPNVDIVLASPYRLPVETASVDLVISGQAFEHIEFFWFTWLELVRVLKPGGTIFLIAPSSGAQHRYPVDCWRFFPDGFRALAKFDAVEVLDVSTDWKRNPGPDDSEWGDTVGVFRKPVLPRLLSALRALEQVVLRQVSCWILLQQSAMEKIVELTAGGERGPGKR